MATKTKANGVPRLTASEERDVERTMMKLYVQEATTRTARERLAKWWGTAAALMARLHADCQEIEAEIEKPDSPLRGFVPTDNLRAAVVAIEQADSALSSLPPLVLDLPDPVEG